MSASFVAAPTSDWSCAVNVRRLDIARVSAKCMTTRSTRRNAVAVVWHRTDSSKNGKFKLALNINVSCEPAA